MASVTDDNKKLENTREELRSIMRRKRKAVEQRLPTRQTIANNFRNEIVEEFLTTPEMTEQIQTVDFPDWRSPIMSSRCPFATGKSTSTTRIPVTTHGVFRERTKIDGDELSTMASLVVKII